MREVYIGWDNGSTGSIGVINTRTNEVYFSPVFTITSQDYTQKKKMVTRLNRPKMLELIKSKLPANTANCFCFAERPMINPQMFNASIIAARAFESMLSILEELNIPYEIRDSKVWQKEMLPAGCSGIDLKQASFDAGLRLFPTVREGIIKHNDADGLLMAEFAKRKGF